MRETREGAMRDTHPPPSPTSDTRRTRQRSAVLDFLSRHSDPVSARELHARMAASGNAVGLTTAYRILHDLERDELLDSVRGEGGQRLYLRRRSAGHRHYLICRHCGRSQPVNTDVVERWAARTGRSAGFTNLDRIIELSGICTDCRPTEGEGSMPQGIPLPHRSPHLSSLKDAVRRLLDLDNDTAVIIRQLASTEPGRPPVKTTVTALPMSGKARHWTLHRSIEQVTNEDLSTLLTT
ncbi:transcriptional repressor [Streptomyces sp. NPDC046876]|uniref:Fur family transcriptional regulator n=1 Tax=Streptomyces sp. NPDC046876 TaxID=3155616 RepID=UPI0033CDA31C